MFLEKIDEINFDENDIYFLEVVGNKIIVNDNYSGVLILNSDLCVEKSIKLFDEMIICNSFIDDVNRRILLYCDESFKFVCIDVITYEFKIIELLDYMKAKNIIFSNVFEWENDKVVLTSFHNNFFLIDLKNGTVEDLDSMYIENHYSKFYCFYQLYLKYLALHKKYITEISGIDELIVLSGKKNSEQLKITVYNKDNCNVVYHENKIEIDFEFCELIKFDNYFFVVGEEKIAIVKGNSTITEVATKSDTFLKIRGMKVDNCYYIIVLLSDELNYLYSNVIKYKIC